MLKKKLESFISWGEGYKMDGGVLLAYLIAISCIVPVPGIFAYYFGSLIYDKIKEGRAKNA